MIIQTKTTWQHTKIGNLGRVATGKTPPTKNHEYYGNKYPFITPTDISDNSIYVTPERYLSEEGARKVASSKLPKNSVCYTCIASIGKIAMTKKDSFTNQQINSIIADPDKADYRYIFYLLRNMTPQIKGMVGGAASPIINKSAFEDIDIEIPKIETQKQIADVLSAYDDLIENNTKRIKVLEQIAQAIYREWFIKNSKFKNQNAKLSEVVKPQYGYTESASNEQIGPKYLRGTDINKNSYIDWSAVPYCKISDEDKKKYQLQKGDILIIRMADPGKIGIVEQGVDAVFASYLIRLKIVDKRISPYYLFYFLNSDQYQNYIRGASGGTTRKSASAGVVTGTNIIIPSKELIDKFEGKVSLLRIELNNLLIQNSNLRQARDLLLPKLITREIRI
jgi:type I restriction enzyme, S subunit